MDARVKQDYRYPAVTAFSGVEYVKYEWRPVPQGRENEAEAHALLDTKGRVVEPEVEEVEVKASDAAIELAEEYGLDLAAIEGTGAGGNITKPDVQAAIDALASEDEDEDVSEATEA